MNSTVEVVSEVPKRRAGFHGRAHAWIYEQADALQDGEWLRVSFGSRAEAERVRLTVANNRRAPYRAAVRGRDLYIRKVAHDRR